MMLNYRYARDFSNASDYFIRPYKIANTAASIIIPEVVVLNGGISIIQGGYFWGIIDMLTAGMGNKVRIANELSPAYRGPMISDLEKVTHESFQVLMR